MAKYIDAKVRFCPKCHQNINDCQCENNKIQFVECSQQKYDEIIKQNKQEQNK